jgi:hypothetical protein
MPMERVKIAFSDFIHNWVIITMITLLLFSVQTGPTVSQAVTVEPQKTEKQLKREIINKFSNETYSSSEMLTSEELKDLLWAVGFEGSALKTAWSFAKIESNGRPLAFNGNKSTGDKSFGIFQINMLGDLGVARKEKFDLVSDKELFDPVTNAEITYHMTDGGKNWSAWSNSTSKAKEVVKTFPVS